jgi:hypothetical protein
MYVTITTIKYPLSYLDDAFQELDNGDALGGGVFVAEATGSVPAHH